MKALLEMELLTQAVESGEEMMQKLDKSIRDIYYTAAALLAVVVLRLA